MNVVDFIKREKIYIAMLLFVISISLANFMHADKKIRHEPTVSKTSVDDIDFSEERLKKFLRSGTFEAKFYSYFFAIGLAVFIGAIISNAMFILRGSKLDMKSLAGAKNVKWDILDVIRAVIFILAMGYLALLLKVFVMNVFNIKIGLDIHAMIDTFLIDMIGLSVVLYFVIVKSRDTLNSLGLHTSNFIKNIYSGVRTYFFILPLLGAILIISGYIFSLFGYNPEAQEVFSIFMGEERGHVLILFAVFIGLFGPMIEEIFFRGFMYKAIKKRFGLVIASFVTASIFSLLHSNIAGFLPIMVLGLVLVYVYEKTGSLLASMAVHILHNSVIVCFMFLLKKLG